MSPENIDMIKRFSMLVILSALFTIVVVMFNGCKMSKPNLKKDYVGMTKLEQRLSYKVDRCRYAQQFTKTDLRCSEIEGRNRKIETIIIYNILSKEKQLPLIYRKSGSDTMTFDDLYKYIK